MRNETETKRNETDRNETKQIQTNRNNNNNIIIIIILLDLKRVTHLAYNNYSSMWPSKDSFTIVHVDRYIQAMQWIIIYNKHRNTKESQYIEIYTCIPEHSSI